jgi:hypothetical protein
MISLLHDKICLIWSEMIEKHTKANKAIMIASNFDLSGKNGRNVLLTL